MKTFLNPALGALLLRIGLGAIFLAHGAFKVFVLGLSRTAEYFAHHGFPAWSAYPAFAIEIVGGLLLLAGWGSRWAALALVPIAAGALLVHAPNGWYFAAPNGGWEYTAFLIVALFAQMNLGDGAFALGSRRPSTPAAAGKNRQPAGALVGRVSLLIALLATLPRQSVAQTEAGRSEHALAEQNQELGRRYFEEVWNRGNLDALDALLAPHYINHTPSTPNPPPGAAGLKPIVRALRQAFPDLHYEIKDLIATEDRVVMRVVMTGTHRGDLFGLPPTGRRVEVDQINIERIENGRIVEHWRVTDELTLMRQLGTLGGQEEEAR